MRPGVGPAGAVLLTTCLLLAGCATGSEPAPEAANDTEPPATTAPAAPAPPPHHSEIYADHAHWLCHPDKADDACDGDLTATAIAPDGTLTTVPHRPAADPPADCFYVYPTVSADQSLNSDLVPGPSELGVATAQAARFDSVCRVFAPVYRQITLAALSAALRPPEPGTTTTTLDAAARQAAGDLAYGDVLDAFKHYMSAYNDGRPVVLIGHSQGAGHLRRLLQEQFDGPAREAERERLLSAVLLGTSVAVPSGADRGGDLGDIPLCREQGQRGCVITYAAFRSTEPPTAGSLFGRTHGGGADLVAGCTNPAALAGGPAPLDAYLPPGRWALADPAAAEAITTPYVKVPDLLTGECVERDGFSYLEVTVQADPDDPRGDNIPGDLLPQWGLHLVDVHLAIGDLVEAVRAQLERP